MRTIIIYSLKTKSKGLVIANHEWSKQLTPVELESLLTNEEILDNKLPWSS